MSFKWPWTHVSEGWTAIDSDGGLFGVNVQFPRKIGERALVLKHAAMPNAVLDQANLTQMAKLMQGSNFPLVHVLGRQDYQMFLVDKAAVRPDEMLSSLRWTLTPLLDYPATEANLSWMDVPQTHAASNRTPRLYVVAARRAVVNQRMGIFERARLSLKSLDIRETGQRNISAAIQDQDAAVCLIYAEPKGVQLTVSYQGELFLERYIRESLFQTNDDGSHTRDEQRFDRVALEIQRSIDLVRRNAASIPFDGIFIAPTQSDIGLVDKLQARLLTNITPLDLSRLFEWPQGSELVKPEVQALYFHALGAALRVKESWR